MNNPQPPDTAVQTTKQVLQQCESTSRRRRLKRVAKWLATSLAVIAAFVSWIIADDIRTLASLRRIEATNAYVMDYYCDYHLENLRDGMNYRGVAITSMTLNESRPPRDPAKPNIMHGTAMRLVLDAAKSADEAIELLANYNIYFTETLGCHYLVADASGRSAVVEFLDGQMRVSNRKGIWQVCTNSQIWQASEAECDEKCDRYRRASAMLASYSGSVEVDQIMDVTGEVAVILACTGDP